MNVALFVPCYVDQLYPRVGLATAELLERAGCTVEFPEGQTCCGQPFANSGFFDDARPLARKFIDVFGKYEHVVCPSGSCTSMVRNHYAMLVEQKAPAVWELCEFLHDVAKFSPRGKFPHKVGLHQSCHGLRELRLASGSERLVPSFNKTRELLTGIEGMTLVELKRPDECCGFGGTFAVAEEAVSCAMGRDRVADHLRGGAEVITGGDVSCLMHMEGLARREGKPVRFMHIAELLAEATA